MRKLYIDTANLDDIKRMNFLNYKGGYHQS